MTKSDSKAARQRALANMSREELLDRIEHQAAKIIHLKEYILHLEANYKALKKSAKSTTKRLQSLINDWGDV